MHQSRLWLARSARQEGDAVGLRVCEQRARVAATAQARPNKVPAARVRVVIKPGVLEQRRRAVVRDALGTQRVDERVVVA